MNQGLILGILTQMARILSTQKLDLRDCPELLVLKYEDEEISDFRKLKPEDILIRWVNYHLKEAGQT